jgi:hypothetical protein
LTYAAYFEYPHVTNVSTNRSAEERNSMRATPEFKARSRAVARVIGPWVAIVPSIIVGARAGNGHVPVRILRKRLFSGLLIIAFHQYWSSPSAILISLFGWFLGLRGFVLVAAPQLIERGAAASMGAMPVVRIGFGVLALIGLGLTFVGWIARPAAPLAKGQPMNKPVDPKTRVRIEADHRLLGHVGVRLDRLLAPTCGVDGLHGRRNSMAGRQSGLPARVGPYRAIRTRRLSERLVAFQAQSEPAARAHGFTGAARLKTMGPPLAGALYFGWRSWAGTPPV